MAGCAQVDTHVHHSACMHQKHLLRFIKSKLKKRPHEVVIFRDGKYLTLLEVFQSLKLTGSVPCACSCAAGPPMSRLPAQFTDCPLGSHCCLFACGNCKGHTSYLCTEDLVLARAVQISWLAA